MMKFLQLFILFGNNLFFIKIKKEKLHQLSKQNLKKSRLKQEQESTSQSYSSTENPTTTEVSKEAEKDKLQSSNESNSNLEINQAVGNRLYYDQDSIKNDLARQSLSQKVGKRTVDPQGNDVSQFVAPGNVTGPNISSDDEIKTKQPHIEYANATPIMQVGSNGSQTDPIRDFNQVESADPCNYLKKQPNDSGVDNCTKFKPGSKVTDPKDAMVYQNGDKLRDMLDKEKEQNLKSKSEQFLSQINKVEKLQQKNNEPEGIANELDLPPKDEIVNGKNKDGFTVGNNTLSQNRNDFGVYRRNVLYKESDQIRTFDNIQMKGRSLYQ